MASINEQLKRIVLKNVRLANGRTIEQTLMEAVDHLYMCIQKRIDEMYNYTPQEYIRRPYEEGLHSALYTEDFLDSRIVGNKIEISLKFSNNVWAWNFDHTHQSNVAYLMNYGWQWRTQPIAPVKRFTYFKGAHFIEDGIEDFNRTNRWGMYISENDIHVDKSYWY